MRFIILVDPSVWRCLLVDILSLIPQHTMGLFQSREVNFGSQSVTRKSRSPCKGNMFLKHAFTTSGAESATLWGNKTSTLRKTINICCDKVISWLCKWQTSDEIHQHWTPSSSGEFRWLANPQASFAHFYWFNRSGIHFNNYPGQHFYVANGSASVETMSWDIWNVLKPYCHKPGIIYP